VIYGSAHATNKEKMSENLSMPEELRLSVSKTKVFSQCKKQFEYNYILKFPKRERDYHILGKFCHKVLEDFHRAYIKGSTLPYNIEMGTAFKAASIEFKAGMTAEMKKQCWDMINEYLQIISEDKKNNKEFNVIDVEKNFKLDIGNNVIMNGMIDRTQIDPDGVLHIADYKTSKSMKYLKKDMFQLLTYAYVYLTEDPSITKIRASYIMLKHNFQYITEEFNVDQILKIKDQYLDYANKIRSETEYAPSPSALCPWCEFNEHCPEAQQPRSFGFNTNTFGEVSY
jgi:putative RecB family exonuclease